MRNAPPGGACTVEVQRLSARVKASKQARKDSRAARVADVTLRYRQVALPCPGAAAVELWVVHAREEHPPPTAEPLEWFVLTTLPVTSTADATRVLRWYALRWRIEEPLDDTERFAAHLAIEFPAIFTFLWDPSVDATNWRAEQAIRPAVVTRKVCGGNRTRKGADTQQVLASVVRTARQRSLDLPVLFAAILRAPDSIVSDVFGLPPPTA